MHRTAADERRKALKRNAKALQKVAQPLPAARRVAQKLTQEEADTALVEAEPLKHHQRRAMARAPSGCFAGSPLALEQRFLAGALLIHIFGHCFKQSYFGNRVKGTKRYPKTF
jgi:hypothetical protein